VAVVQTIRRGRPPSFVEEVGNVTSVHRGGTISIVPAGIIVYNLLADPGTYTVTAGDATLAYHPAVITGGLSFTQAPQTVVATGNVTFGGTVTGSLNLNQAPQTIVATGSVTPLGPATGALSLNQADQTLLATGNVTFTGTIIGTLAVAQMAQSLAASGIVNPSGSGYKFSRMRSPVGARSGSRQQDLT
jgi:hypothetical protein